MKTIGMIGGMSYESSIHYYERINNQVNALAGELTVTTTQKEENINEIDRIIFEELCKGETKDSSREYYKRILY